MPEQPLIVREAPRMRSRKLTRCGGCALYPDLCVCSSLPALQSRTEVVVLLHRLERYKTTNTGRLAARTLARGQSATRDRFASIEVTPVPRSYVLFPKPDAMPLTEAIAHGIDRLIVPDGTWPQAGRLAHLLLLGSHRILAGVERAFTGFSQVRIAVGRREALSLRALAVVLRLRDRLGGVFHLGLFGSSGHLVCTTWNECRGDQHTADPRRSQIGIRFHHRFT